MARFKTHKEYQFKTLIPLPQHKRHPPFVLFSISNLLACCSPYQKTENTKTPSPFSLSLSLSLSLSPHNGWFFI
jgi:hypothetical protein